MDALPGTHSQRKFAERHRWIVWLAIYRQSMGHERVRATGSEVNRYRINRLEALDEVFDLFHRGILALPRDARQLGGHVKDHLGAYYRQVLVPKRTLERDAHGNPVYRWKDNERPDHYAHAELYCMMAGNVRSARMGRPIRW